MLRMGMACIAAVVMIAAAGAASAFAQSVAPSVSVDAGQPSATPHWTINLSAPYCGGYRIGDGVYLSPEAPLAFPDALPDGSVLFAGNPASVDLENGVLRVSLGPRILQSMICIQGDRPFSVELLPSAGFTLPDIPGDYAIDVWTGASPTPVTATVTVPDSSRAD
jgi:hypothetical protein